MENILSLNFHTPAMTSSSNLSLFHDQNLHCEERFMFLNDSQCGLADDYYYKEIQKLYEEKRELFAYERALAAKNVMIKKRERLLIEEDDNKKKKIKLPMKMDSAMLMNEDITVQLKRYITGEMYGLDMKLVIQKTLFESDLNTTQNRLNMPIKQLFTRPHEFLTAEEIHIVNESKDGIEVRVVGPTLQMYKRPLRLKMWHMKCNDNYVLKTNWNNFVAENKVLEKHTKIQVWSFRKNRQLCFAIVLVERPDAANNFCYSC